MGFERRIEQGMTGALAALIYFLPISTALVEILSAFVISFFLLKRGFLYYQCCRASPPAGQSRLVFWGRALLFSFRPAASFLARPLSIFCLVVFLSVVFSHDLALSLKGFFFKLIQGLLLYAVFLECMVSEKRVRIFTGVLLTSATLVSLSGIIQYFTGKDFFFGHGLIVGRVTSCFKHPNDLGSYLVVVIPILLSLLTGGGTNCARTAGQEKFGFIFPKICCRLGMPRSGKLFAMIVIFILFVSCLALTFSRGAWISFLLSMIFLAVFRRKIFGLILLIGMCFLIFFTPQMKAERQNTLFSPETYLIGEGRDVYWREAWQVIKDSPVLGTGLNTYSEVAPAYKISWGGYAHNCYLQMTAETGFLGLAAFLWLIFILFRETAARVRKGGHPFLDSLLLGYWAGFFAFLVHGFMDTNFYSVKLANLMWLLIGMIVAIHRFDLAEGRTTLKSVLEKCGVKS